MGHDYDPGLGGICGTEKKFLWYQGVVDCIGDHLGIFLILSWNQTGRKHRVWIQQSCWPGTWGVYVEL